MSGKGLIHSIDFQFGLRFLDSERSSQGGCQRLPAARGPLRFGFDPQSPGSCPATILRQDDQGEVSAYICQVCEEPMTGAGIDGVCQSCLLVRPTDGASGKPVPSEEQVAAALPRFKIHELAGRGALSVVYRATDTSLEKNCRHQDSLGAAQPGAFATVPARGIDNGAAQPPAHRLGV